jgi:UDP-N-acetylglucosamine--N-acetylmuramyl-(pentapeptide) pyrophosphoryl-undecaprenol N-acetylglucosamine transferase
MKVFFSGGGTLGPVTPLLAMKEMIVGAHPEATFFWVGAKDGPEKKLITEAHMPHLVIHAGKLRRYWSIANIKDIFYIILGFFESLHHLWKENPDVCISAGGFASVPLHYAAWILGIPTWIHQQDVKVGLANRLMTPIAKQITTALQEGVHKFPRHKTRWLGNPIRQGIFAGSAERAKKRFNLSGALPIVFVTGGGTGSIRVNDLAVEAMSRLMHQVDMIHVYGTERPADGIEQTKKMFPHSYRAYPFFTEEMNDAYAVADVVISRGGFGTLSELAALKKPSILIPKPGQQEDNVTLLAKAEAVVLVDERTTSGLHLAQIIRGLVDHKEVREVMGERLYHVLPPAKKEQIIEVLDEVLR